MSSRKERLNLKPRQLWPIWVALGVVTALGGTFAWVSISQLPKPSVSVTTEDLTLSEDDLAADRPSLYRYRVDPRTEVEFFVSKTADSRIEAGFASCRRCYRAGHYRSGRDIMCGYCSGSMRLARSEKDLPAEKDCTLVPLTVERHGKELVVRGESIRAGFKHWFLPVLAQAN